MGLFGISLLLHYFTPYYEQQTIPDFMGVVLEAPFEEEIIFRFLGVLVAYICISKMVQTELLWKKSIWGMSFILAMYLEVRMTVLRIENQITQTAVLITLLLLVLFTFRNYQLEILLLVSSAFWALAHEYFRFIPVFVAGLFFSLLCINRSRIYDFDTQRTRVKVFLILYGTFIGYIIHLWNNSLNWAFYQTLDPLIIDTIVLIGLIFGLLLIEKWITPFIDERVLRAE